MRLKSVYLRGFKTFADATRIEFAPGITAIVGPNGTGKSNIVDAILWALGEQAPSALRISSGAELIFAGSDKRRGLGMAEVSLVLDNSDGRLGVDFSEVEITRRIYRNGESEYLLNRSACRLKDIRDLLLDTGAGPEGYSVIGQGEIEQILSARPEDRLALMEEAAGVRKYRVRREEASRRLEKTAAEMQRLEDIIAELERHIEPLREDADKARRYRELDARLRELEVKLWAAEWLRRRRRLGRLENQKAAVEAELEEASRKLERAKAELERTRSELAEAAGRLEALREELIAAERGLSEARRLRELAEQRRNAAVSRAEELERTAKEAAERAERIRQRLRALKAEEQAASAELAETAKRAEALGRELEAAREDYSARLEAARAHADLVRRISERIARARQEVKGLVALEAELVGRIGRLERQEAEVAEKLQAYASQEREAAARLSQAREAEHEAAEAEAFAQQQLEAARRRALEHRSKLEAVRRQIAALEGQVRALNEAAVEGSAAAEIIQAAGRGELSGVVGVLGELLAAEPEWQAALAAALGPRAEWVVVERPEDARRAAEFVGRAGEVGFVILSQCRHEAPAVGGRRLADMIQADEALWPIVETLLGDVLIVDTAEQALELSRRTGLPVASRDGALAGRGGAELYIAADEASPLLGRARAVQKLERKLERARRSAEKLGELERQAAEEQRRAEAELAAARKRREEARRRRERAEEELRQAQQGQEAARKMLAELRSDALVLQSRLEKARAERRVAEETATGLAEELEAIRAEAGADEVEAAAERVRRLEAQLGELEVERARLEQRIEASRREAEREAAELQRAEAEQERARDAAQAALEQAERAGRELERLPGTEDLERQVEQVRQRLEGLRGTVRQLQARAEQLEAERRELERACAEKSDELHRLEVAAAREEAQVATLEEQFEDRFGKRPAEIAEQLGDGFTRAAAEREAEELKRQIRELGVVNLGAAAELERLEARRDYLLGQLDDVRRARDELLDLIAELDEAARDEFLQAFERISAAFDETFKRLFGGGETKLVLTKPDDPLSGGVDIIVRPPGKKLQNMLLLSGGEKALTAMAFIFALLRVRPSPFCVMDEIDAALDASNTSRFVRLLRDFAEDTQFIVVTHNPETIAAASQIYGVTMQEPGVSIVLALELEEAKKFTEREQRRFARVVPASQG